MSQSKPFLAALLLLTLGLVGAGVLGQAAEPGDGLSQTDGLSEEEQEQQERVSRRLEVRVNLDKGIPANTAFTDVLEFLMDRYDLTIIVDRAALAAGGVRIDDLTVQLPKMVGLSLSRVLQMLVQQVALDNGTVACFRARPGYVEITTDVFDDAVLGMRELFPSAMLEPLRKVVRIDKDPENMTVSEALAYASRLWGVKLVLDQKAFAEVGEPAIGKLAMNNWGSKLPMEPDLLGFVEMAFVTPLNLPFLEGRKDPKWTTFFRVSNGQIEITAVRFGSKRARLLEKHVQAVHDAREAAKVVARLDEKQLPENIVDKGIADGTPLVDILDFLGDRYDLNIILNDSDFKAAGIDKVADSSVRINLERKALSVNSVLHRSLASVAGDDYTAAPVFHRDWIEVVPRHKQLHAKKPLEMRHLDKLWDDLATAKSPRARLSAQTLVQGAREALPYLSKRLQPAPLPERDLDKRARALVPDLESTRFAVRQRATEELEKLGRAAIPALRERLLARPPLEVRTRIDLLLKKEKVRRSRLKAGEIQAIRAINVLAGIGTSEARALLQRLAAGAPHVVQTETALAALKRLED
jgi:DNA-binding HxlR family transcriptional regulator